MIIIPNKRKNYCCHCSVAKSCLTLCNPMDCRRQASWSFSISGSLLKFMSIELVMLSNHLTPCHPLLLLPSMFASIRVFSSESALHIRWPKHRSFSFSIHPSNEYSGLISFRNDWFDLLAVQGTLKNLLQHHTFGERHQRVSHLCPHFLIHQSSRQTLLFAFPTFEFNP